jgi:hypothetical protein
MEKEWFDQKEVRDWEPSRANVVPWLGQLVNRRVAELPGKSAGRRGVSRPTNIHDPAHAHSTGRDLRRLWLPYNTLR